MRKSGVAVIVVLLVACGVKGVFAESSVQEDFKQAAEYAADLLEQKGQQGLLELEHYSFCDAKGFLIVTNTEGQVFIHTAHPALKGQNSLGIKDAKGGHFGLNIKNVAGQGGGWLDYWWPDATTKAPVQKTMYVTTGIMEGISVVIAAGIR